MTGLKIQKLPRVSDDAESVKTEDFEENFRDIMTQKVQGSHDDSTRRVSPSCLSEIPVVFVKSSSYLKWFLSSVLVVGYNRGWNFLTL